ncbi:hypothetical protein DPX16_11226 [Anabarilius grahami]|uniref:Uncharacterized protein n=1 Tax=Anabarilius grahami TaxID=495550 RepID=A0A3N0Y2J5_ANAGA|nr:hypothetical protein DPX16_11226 [Anabarilius grahami]
MNVLAGEGSTGNGELTTEDGWKRIRVSQWPSEKIIATLEAIGIPINHEMPCKDFLLLLAYNTVGCPSDSITDGTASTSTPLTMILAIINVGCCPFNGCTDRYNHVKPTDAAFMRFRNYGKYEFPRILHDIRPQLMDQISSNFLAPHLPSSSCRIRQLRQDLD